MTNPELQRDPASFRDPSGHVVVGNDAVYRLVMPFAAADFSRVRATSLFPELIKRGWLLNETLVPSETLGDIAKDASFVVKHPKLPLVTYPYEWTFAALKAAALRHLDIHLLALTYDITLSDATAYNIQFIGTDPVFIDHLSFRPYQAGEYWLGHRQFCQQFLNPLLLTSRLGVPFQPMYRGQLNGISPELLVKLLPWYEKCRLSTLLHVVLQAKFTQASRTEVKQVAKQSKLGKAQFVHMLKGLHKLISGLTPQLAKTEWQHYATGHNYQDNEVIQKLSFIQQFATSIKPAQLWDIGCNDGKFSKAALQAGAQHVFGFDADIGALEYAYANAKTEALSFFPLLLDLTNPSPSMGWALTERQSWLTRAKPDAIQALALIHHLAISHNIPLARIVDLLVSLAPHGIIEFVPKADPMVQTLLALRQDIFPDYTQACFESYLKDRARIVAQQQVTESGRILYWYQR
jgi:ribosomal protein L11 methylase PrmA